MPRLVLALFAGLPLTALAGPLPVPAEPKTVRVSLVNLSSQRRQVITMNGPVALPLGRRVDIDSHAGCGLHVVSDMDSEVNLHFCVSAQSEAALLVVR